MKGNIATVSFAAIILAIAFSASASAQVCDSGCGICVGQETDFILTVENTGTSDDMYTISNPYDWVEVQDSVFIEAGSTTDIKVNVTPKQTGTNIFELTVTGSKEAPKKVKGMVSNVVECRDVTVIASPSEVSVCEGMPAVFDVIIKNTGQVRDSYQLATSLGSLEVTEVELEPGESTNIQLSISTDQMVGVKDVMVSASNGAVSDTEAITAEVKNCYSAELNIIPAEQTLCPCTSVDYTVMITNTGELPDEYVVDIEGKTQTVALNAGEAKELSFSIPMLLGSGSRDVKATAESTNVYVEDTATLNIRPAEECFTAEIASEPELDIVRCKADTVPIRIKNTGEQMQLFQLDLEAPDWVYLSRDDAYVNPGEEKEVYLYISPPYETDLGIHDVIVTATTPHSEDVLKLVVTVLDEEGNVDVTVPDTDTPDVQEPDTGQEESQEPPETQPNDTGVNGSGGGDGVSSEIIGIAAPFWKTAVVAVITLIIVVILVVRFAVLVRK